MRLLLLTYGTEGDTRPQAMLARGLLDAGHEACLLAEQQTLGTAAQLGVPHAALAGPITAEVDALVGQGNNLRAASRGLARMAQSLTDAWVEQADAAAAAGFADQPHMTRIFTRQFGFTPGAWKSAVLRRAQ